jgi:amino acid transporter
VGYASMTAAEQVESWFEAYLAAPIVIIMFLAFKIIKKTRFRRLSEIDIDSGKRELDLTAILAEERAEQAKWPMWKKIWKTIC